MENWETFHAEDFLLCFSVFLFIANTSSFLFSTNPLTVPILCLSRCVRCTILLIALMQICNPDSYLEVFIWSNSRREEKSEEKKVESPLLSVYGVWSFVFTSPHHHLCVCLCCFEQSLSECNFCQMLFHKREISNAIVHFLNSNKTSMQCHYCCKWTHLCDLKRAHFVITCTNDLFVAIGFCLCTFTTSYMFTHC